MDKSPEEQFNSDLWHILQKIKKQFLYTAHKQNIKYSIVQGFFGSPYNNDEKALVEKLNDWHIITLEGEDGVFSWIEGASRVFNIKEINHPKFQQLYQLYENALKKQVASERLFKLVQELVTPRGNDMDLSFELWKLTKKVEDESNERTLKSLMIRELTNIQLVYNLSAENRSRIKRLIEIIQNQIELTGYTFSVFGKDPLEIPADTLQREGYNIPEAELLIDFMDRSTDGHFIKVITLGGIGLPLIDSEVRVPGASLYLGRSDDVEEINKKLIIAIQSPSTLQNLKAHIEGFEKRLAESLTKKDLQDKKPEPEKVKKTSKQTATDGMDEIYYNSKTGVGEINGKAFKIKPSDKAFEVFASLYGTMNNPVSRQDVLVNSGFYEDGQEPDLARRGNETYHINEIAKTIRRIVNIDTKKLINNDGNLTLIGLKQKFPKVDQT